MSDIALVVASFMEPRVMFIAAPVPYIQRFSVSVGNPYSGSFKACHNCLFHLTGWREREEAVFQERRRYSGSEREWLIRLMQ